MFTYGQVVMTADTATEVVTADAEYKTEVTVVVIGTDGDGDNNENVWFGSDDSIDADNSLPLASDTNVAFTFHIPPGETLWGWAGQDGLSVCYIATA
jgi:hypothetical protein